jgi:hypothetical protein
MSVTPHDPGGSMDVPGPVIWGIVLTFGALLRRELKKAIAFVQPRPIPHATAETLDLYTTIATLREAMLQHAADQVNTRNQLRNAAEEQSNNFRELKDLITGVGQEIRSLSHSQRLLEQRVDRLELSAGYSRPPTGD